MGGALLLKSVRPGGGPAVDVRIGDGRIVEIGPGLAPAAEADVIDGRHAIAIPGFVEAHTHLDKTLWGMPWHANQAGPSLLDRIENERRLRGPLGVDPAVQSRRQALQSIRMGTTHIRTHVDIDTEIGLKHFEGVVATRERLRPYVDIEIVAFPQSGMLVRPGTIDLLEAAMRSGADVIGGIDPSVIDRDPVRHLDTIFGLADKYRKPLDIHLHEPNELGTFAVELIVERTRALGLQGKVMISHAFCLGGVDDATLDRLLAALVDARIAVMTTGPAGRPCPSIKRLREAGVVVCSGSDGIRDTWGPFGNADMLERATLLAMRNNMRKDAELEMCLDVVTYGGAAALGLPAYGIVPGNPADLVLLEGETPAEAVASKGPRALVIKNGRVVARDGQCLVPAE
jgi:cytosine/adenosine deaminase-related metal-dependent hydrolase